MINLHNLSNTQLLSEYNETVVEFEKELIERGFNNIIIS